MKKIVTLTALIFLFVISSTAFAAANISDVPGQHWAYGAVNQLSKAGLVEGYGDGTFRGDKPLTRYEFAVVTARALEKYSKADDQQKVLLDKLSAEFATELNTIGVRLTNLEKKASSVKFTGDSRIRYLRNPGLVGTDAPGSDSSHVLQERVRLYITSSLTDNIDFAGRISATNISNSYAGGIGAGAETSKTNDLQFDTAKFTFKNAFHNTDVSIGRESLALGQSFIVSDTAGNVDNIRINYKNGKLSGFAAIADIAPAYGNNNGTSVTSKNITIAQLAWKANRNTQITGGVVESTNTSTYNYKQRFIGASYNLNKDWNLLGDYVKNTAATYQGKGGYVKLSYKGADYAKVGSWGTYVDYRKIGANAIDGTITTLNSFNSTHGIKGYGVGVNYTFAKNAKLTTAIEKLKSFNNNIKFDPFAVVKAELIF